MKTTEQLINNIIGQANGIKKMINAENDCYLVINQMKAVRSAVSSLMNKYIEENVNKCLTTPNKKESRDMMKKLFREISKK